MPPKRSDDPVAVARLVAQGLYGRFSVDQRFHPDLTIIHGANGSGKTTLLHILANALNEDFDRFAYLDFARIEIEIADGRSIHLDRTGAGSSDPIRVRCFDGELLIDPQAVRRRDDEEHAQRSEARRAWVPTTREPDDEHGAPSPLVGAAYFPAFRTMLEASRLHLEPRLVPSRLRSTIEWPVATGFVRELFGGFAPSVSFASLIDIERALEGEAYEAWRKVALAERNALSSIIRQVFAALFATQPPPGSTPDELLAQVEQLLSTPTQSAHPSTGTWASSLAEDLRKSLPRSTLGPSETTAARVLDVYRRELEIMNKKQAQAYERIYGFLDSVNRFLEGKEIRLQNEPAPPRDRVVTVAFKGGESVGRGLRALSSGERQVVSLVYAATHMSKQSVVLVDEPELSLHVDWQRRLLTEMVSQLGGRQVIACTHSPVIAHGFSEKLVELNPVSAPRAHGEWRTDDEGLIDDEDVFLQ